MQVANIADREIVNRFGRVQVPQRKLETEGTELVPVNIERRIWPEGGGENRAHTRCKYSMIQSYMPLFTYIYVSHTNTVYRRRQTTATSLVLDHRWRINNPRCRCPKWEVCDDELFCD